MPAHFVWLTSCADNVATAAAPLLAGVATTPKMVTANVVGALLVYQRSAIWLVETPASWLFSAVAIGASCASKPGHRHVDRHGIVHAAARAQEVSPCAAGAVQVNKDLSGVRTSELGR